jgi:hypothetical protein
MTKAEVRIGLQVALAREGHKTAGMSLLGLGELVLKHGLTVQSLNPAEPQRAAAVARTREADPNRNGATSRL